MGFDDFVEQSTDEELQKLLAIMDERKTLNPFKISVVQNISSDT